MRQRHWFPLRSARRRPRLASHRSGHCPTIEPLEGRLLLDGVSDSVVVFNEIMYHPAGDGTPEWIELHNQMSVNVDLSGWSLGAGLSYAFPPGTIIEAGGYLVISADPAAMAATTGFTGALGPWTGNLNNAGERIELRENNGRVMNRLEYNDRGDWPVAPDGSGATLAKINPDANSEPASSWTSSAQVGGTPGAVNFPPTQIIQRTRTVLGIGAAWRYDDTGTDLGTAWRAAAFDDSAWATGNALFFNQTGALPAPTNTPLQPGHRTYYFRTNFEFDGDPNAVALQLDPVVDDGAVYYLNGVEVHRQNMPNGPITFGTAARSLVGDAAFAGPITIPVGALAAGTNVLAVEVHQADVRRAYAQAVLESGPVGYWRLGESSALPGGAMDAADAAGPPQQGAQLGTFGGFNVSDFAQAGPRPTDLVNGQPLLGFETDNASARFNGNLDGGDNVVAVTDTGVLNFASNRAFTLEAWVNGSNIQESGGAILAKGTGGGGEQFSIDVVNGQYRFFVWNGGSPNTPTVVQSAVSLNNTWQHVVGTFDAGAGVMRLYVNGQLAGSAAPPSTIVNTTHEVSIGARKNASSAYDLNFDGRIDEVAVYPRAFDLAEVTAHFNAAFDGSFTPGIDPDVAFGTKVLVVETLPDALLVDETLVALNDSWRYDASGSDLGTAWRQSGYDDAAWSMGDAPFALGTPTLPLPPGTALDDGPITYYFRRTFSVADVEDLTSLTLDSFVGDGAVVYLNGVEVQRINMPAGAIAFDTPALSRLIDIGESSIAVPLDALQAQNVLAVEVHRAAAVAPLDYAQSVLVSGPVVYLRLNESSSPAVDAADAAGPPQLGAQNGTYSGFNVANLAQPGPRPTDSVAGQPLLGMPAANNAPNFQGNLDGGNDVVLIPDTGNLNFSAGRAFSLEAWVNGAASQEGGGAVFAKGTGGGGEQFALDLVNNQYRFFVRNSSGAATVLQSAVATNNTWQHVVATFDSAAGIMRLYVNGQQVAATTPPTTLLNSSHEVSIGARKNSGSVNYDLNFAGRIDEAAIYGRALSAAEVTAHFNAARTSPVVPDPRAAFTAELTTVRITPGPTSYSVVLNEIAGANDAMFHVELFNHGGAPLDVTGLVIAREGGLPRAEFVVPSMVLPAGGYVTFNEAVLGFDAADNDRIFLYNPDETIVLDAIDVHDRLRGRVTGGTSYDEHWFFADAATPGAANSFAFNTDIVINEIMYHPLPLAATADTPATYATTTLIQFTDVWRYNRTGADLGSGWAGAAHAVDGVNWLSGAAPLGVESDPLPPGLGIATTFPAYNPAVVTYYFERDIVIGGTPQDLIGTQLQLRTLIDDGAVVYVNGVEVYRFNMPAGAIGAATPASPGVADATVAGPITIPDPPLIIGTNRISVEVHQSSTTSSDIVFALEVAAAIELTPFIPGEPFRESDAEWIELFNRSAQPINLSGWRLTDAVDFTFAPGTVLGPGQYIVVAKDAQAMAEQYPGVVVAGYFSRSLANDTDRIRLLDAAGNIADELTYFDGGRWPSYGDGHGASIELRDPFADNLRGEAWADSDEAADSQWQTITYRGPAVNRLPGAPTLWHEFAMGLLAGAGELLIDDVSVIEDPDGSAIERIQNGSFSDGANHWRLLGNHSHSSVITDPDDPGNAVLHLVATGPTEYQGNQIETTFGGGATIVEGRVYEISFRVRWLAGSNQLNTRLYFDRLARTTILDAPMSGGTPGAPNSRLEANIGPTFDNLLHGPAVPQPGLPATVSVNVEDPQSVATVTLHYSVNGGAWQSLPMAQRPDGKYAADVPGQGGGTLVQFYVEAIDSLGAAAFFPAAGPDSRALIRWNDGQATTAPRHNFRILMTDADTNLLHLSHNTTSNDKLGATIIYNESEIYYDAGVRLKGSFVGRDVPRVGFHVTFNPDQLFRGVHGVVSVDRSQTTTAISPAEVILFHVGNHAGGIPSRYDDIIHVIAPRSAQTSVAHLRLAGYDDLFFDSWLDNGSDGNVYEYEVIRWATTTLDGNPESVKRSAQFGNGFASIDFQNLGDNKEDYRWINLLTNNRRRDDFDDIIAFHKSMSLTGTALDAATQQTMDVDQWMRVFALQALGSIADAYSRGAPHNLRLYTRPDDGRVLALPWDWDNIFNSPTAAIIGSSVLTNVINIPHNLRLYYGHLHDMIGTTFNTAYMQDWTNHYGEVAGINYAGVLSFISQRAAFVTSQLPAQVTFRITTNGGNDFQVNDVVATLAGDGWINVREIRLAGSGEPLAVTWTDFDSWTLTLPVAFGDNALVLEAYDFQGNLIASDSITVNSTVSVRPLQDYLRITEVHYNPADPIQAEIDAGFNDAQMFEFIELKNISTTETLDLSDARFADGIEFGFAGASVTSLGPGQFVVVAKNLGAFNMRYGSSPVAIMVAGEFGGQLNNAGERLLLVDANSVPIMDFTYDDDATAGWPALADGGGASLDIRDPLADRATWNDAASWRLSGIDGGTPGRRDPVDGALPGDVTYNGAVDITDLSRLATNFGLDGVANPMLDVRWKHGDFNGDRRVNITDLSLLATRFGQMGFAAGAAAGAPMSGDGADLLREASEVRRTVIVTPPSSSGSTQSGTWRHITDILAN